MTDQPPPPAPHVPPFAPIESAAAGRRSRTPLLVGIVLAVIAAAVVVVLLADGGDGGGSGAGELSGTVDGDSGGIITREVSLPAGSALLVRVEPDEDFDVVASLLTDRAAAEEAADLAEDLDIDPSDLGGDPLLGAYEEFLASDDSGDTDELADEDDADEEHVDALPPVAVFRTDLGFEGDEELFLFLTLDDADLTLAFTGYEGDDGSFEATIDIVDLDVDGGDADDIGRAVLRSEELADLTNR